MVKISDAEYQARLDREKQLVEQVGTLRAQLAAVTERAEKAEAAMNPTKLSAAWKKYDWLFAESPHGTEKQMGALLALVPVTRPTADRDALAARVAQLEGAIQGSLRDCLEQPTQAYAGDTPHCCVCGGWQDRMGWLDHKSDCVVPELKAALASTVPQSLAKVQAAALRHFRDHVRNLITATREVSNDEWTKALEACESEAETMADRLESEAANG